MMANVIQVSPVLEWGQRMGPHMCKAHEAAREAAHEVARGAAFSMGRGLGAARGASA